MHHIGIKDFKNLTFSKSILYIYLHKIVAGIGAGFASTFVPIFLYEQYDLNLFPTILIFFLLYFLQSLLIPVGARFMSKIGVKYSMLIAMPFLVISIGALMNFDIDPLFMVVVYLFTYIIFRTLFWLPYHIDLALFTDKATRGRQFAVLQNLSQLILAAAPFVGGFLIASSGFANLFLIVMVFYAISTIPLFFIDSTYENYEYTYHETFRRLLGRENRDMVIANFSDGIQGSVHSIIWPLFIFGILAGEYIAIGGVVSITIVVMLIARFYVGDLYDTWDKDKVVKYGTILYTTGWVIKIFVSTGLEVILIDSYHKIGRAVQRTSFDTALYEQAADQGHYVDEYTVLREMSLNFGRTSVLFLSLILTLFLPLNALFIVAAIATAFMMFLVKKHSQKMNLKTKAA